MRLRKRHAWGAVLIALFALPVLRPEGFPSIERPTASFVAWFARIPALNPRLWTDGKTPASEESPALAAAERDRAQIYERLAQEIDLRSSLEALQEVFRRNALDRLPVVVPARVLRAVDPSNYRHSLLIDRGSEDDVVEGAAVAQGDVFLGRVEVVHGRSALVKLVTDPRSRVEVAIRTDKDQRVRGFLRGVGRGGKSGDLEIRFAAVREETGAIPVGAPVFTSNADERIPAGLLVGYVTKVSDPDADGMPILSMRPAFNLDRALDVFVLTPR